MVSPWQHHFGPGGILPASLHQAPQQLPSPDSFLSVLQNCRESKDLVHAKIVHTHICEYGLESLPSMGNFLVPMYVECGSLQDAQSVFNKFSHQNEHSWTSLIQGHVECGHLLYALDLFKLMQAHNVLPSTHTFVALLKACSQLKSITKGLEVYTDILLYGLETHTFVSNTLVDMFSNCGTFAEATYVFDKLSHRDIVSWTALIALYAEQKRSDEAFHSLELMLAEGISPNAYTFLCSLKACDATEDADKVYELHREITKHGFEQNTFIGNALIDIYAKCGLFLEAQEAFAKLQQRDVVAWTALIAGYTQHGLAEEALDHLKSMHMEGVCPNTVTYVYVLKSCGIIGAIEKGHELHTEVVKQELDEEISMGNALVDMYATCASLEEAQKVFDSMPTRNLDSWNTLIAQFAEHGYGKEALVYLELMRTNGIPGVDCTFATSLKACGTIEAIEQGSEIHSEIVKAGSESEAFIGSALVDMYAKCHALSEAQYVCDHLPARDPVIWTALITGYTEHSMGNEALSSFQQMQADGCLPDVVTLVCCLKACSIAGAIQSVQDLHSWMSMMGLEEDPLIVRSLVNAYSKCSFLLDARDVFEKLSFNDPAVWNALMAGYIKQGRTDEAFDLLEDMRLEGVMTDVVTTICSLKACGIAVAADRGTSIHDEVVKKGLERVSFVGNSLVDMYAKCGLLAEAKLLVRDVISWTSLMTGYWEHGFGEEALNCFEEMPLQGVFPDAVTFLCSLKACISAQSLSEGQQVHAEIVKEGFEEDPIVCSNLVELYSKSGLNSEAQDVSDLMPSKDERFETSLGG